MSVSLTPTVRAGFGISNTIAVTATACTAAGTVNSGSALSVTGIGDSGSKVVLEVTAADGTTKKSYTFNFVKKSTDTSITNFTVTANDPSGTTIVNDPTQGVDYYFKLPALESGDSKGKMNITAASGATVKLGSNAYSPATECAVGSYTVNVTAPAGNTQAYRVTLAREEVAAVFNSLGIRLPGSTTFEEVLTGNSAYDAATNTYTKTLTIGGANVVGAEIYIEGTRKTGVTYGTPTNLTLSGDTFTGKLALGDNSFSVRIASQGKSNTYTFHIKLTEGKKGITDVVIYDAETGGNVIALSPAFNPSTKTYTVTVPYKNMDNAYFVVTTDGEYTVVDTVSGGRMSRVDGTLNKHKHTRPLAAGATTTVRIHAVADEGKGDSGEEYVINITRAAASTDAKLSGLVVKGPDGTPLKFTDPDGNEVTFDGNTTNYTIKYDGDIAALVVDIEATASGLNAEVNGAGRVNLGSLGATSDNVTRIPITVTAEDGVT
ncbi:MAG: cadherin-like beta sandwich domain-containing protein, partial [Clostridia bacterium]|nr:cadherin-like beta sandwich domain-containing protein [Clostridia bacterium]